MWCNWGVVGGRMWWPHGWGVGPLGLLLLVGLVVLVIMLWRKSGGDPRLTCPSCKGVVLAAYLRCPHCGATLKRHCPKCAGIIEATWKYCPTCEPEGPADSGK